MQEVRPMPRNTASSTDDIQSLVNDFTERLTVVMRRSALEEVLATLQQGGLQTGSRAGRPAKASRPMRAAKKGGRRSAEHVEQMGQSLYDYVKKNPGQRGEQIAKAMRTDVGTMRLPMRKLIADKRIKTKGQRRGMTYLAV